MVARVAAVLRSFDEHHRQLPLTAIARRSGLPLSTTHRLTADLVSEGLLARVGSEYVVGRTMWEVGLLAPVEATLREKASPFLHDLYAATPSTIHLAVRDDDQVLYLERLRGQTSVEIVSDVGSILPLHATGVGKVLLAYAPADIQRRVLANLTPVTEFTITLRGPVTRAPPDPAGRLRADQRRNDPGGRVRSPCRSVAAAKWSRRSARCSTPGRATRVEHSPRCRSRPERSTDDCRSATSCCPPE